MIGRFLGQDSTPFSPSPHGENCELQLKLMPHRPWHIFQVLFDLLLSFCAKKVLFVLDDTYPWRINHGCTCTLVVVLLQKVLVFGAKHIQPPKVPAVRKDDTH
jgi:hypothetical protein